jgi:hypothetical protein
MRVECVLCLGRPLEMFLVEELGQGCDNGTEVSDESMVVPSESINARIAWTKARTG